MLIMDYTIKNDKNDWRLQGQEKYLMKAKLLFTAFNSSVRDHDHCAFCHEKFSELDEDLHEGYCTLAKYHWICKSCFNDFKDLFEWQVVN
jgi:hypothetical protein